MLLSLCCVLLCCGDIVSSVACDRAVVVAGHQSEATRPRATAAREWKRKLNCVCAQRLRMVQGYAILFTWDQRHTSCHAYSDLQLQSRLQQQDTSLWVWSIVWKHVCVVTLQVLTLLLSPFLSPLLQLHLKPEPERHKSEQCRGKG